MTPNPVTRQRIRSRVEAKLRPMTLPNFITLVRMAIIPFFVIAVVDGDYRLALWIFLLAGITDALDGWIARRFAMRSVVGAYLDPLADKLLVTAAYVSLTIPLGQEVVIPLWLTILALFRDFLILLMAAVLYLVEGLRRFPPSKLGKASTFAHVATVLVVLLANVFDLPTMVPTGFFYLTFALVILSGFSYIYRASDSIEEARLERQPVAKTAPVEDPRE
jgi:cardiolipin synthase